MSPLPSSGSNARSRPSWCGSDIASRCGAFAISCWGRRCVEPRQNIALARNMAVANAKGDFIAFIDDDELPGGEWLLTLFSAYQQYGVDGVLGPVKPRFDEPPPKWVVDGRFCERPSYPTGFVIDWR